MLSKALVLLDECFGMNYSRKSYYIYYSLMFFIAYSFCRTSENCKLLVLQEKCNIEIFLSPDVYGRFYFFNTIFHAILFSFFQYSTGKPQ